MVSRRQGLSMIWSKSSRPVLDYRHKIKGRLRMIYVISIELAQNHSERCPSCRKGTRYKSCVICTWKEPFSGNDLKTRLNIYGGVNKSKGIFARHSLPKEGSLASLVRFI